MKSTSGLGGMVRRWFGHPTLSIMIAVCWLLLQQSLALPQLISAAVLGWLLPRLIRGFLTTRFSPGSLRHVLRLFGVVVWDIVESNLVVARLVLTPGLKPRPGWIKVPMEIRHPLAQTLLAIIITNTPGTVACAIDEDANEITVHVLDSADPEELVEQIKQRYEQPLKEIFG